MGIKFYQSPGGSGTRSCTGILRSINRPIMSAWPYLDQRAQNWSWRGLESVERVQKAGEHKKASLSGRAGRPSYKSDHSSYFQINNPALKAAIEKDLKAAA